MRDFLARIFGSTIRQSVKTFGDLSPAVNHHGNGDVNITYGESRDDAKLKHTEIQQELRLLPDAIEKRLISAIQQSSLLPQAAAQGLAERTIFALAARLNPEVAQDLEQALVELQAAVDIALEIRRRGLTPGSNEDAFISEILAEVAKRNQEGQLDAGAVAVDSGLLQLEAMALEQQQALRRKRITLLETGIEQDLLRRDASAVAKRVETLVALDAPRRPAWSADFRARRDAFYEQGRDKGLQLPIEVAIAMARRMEDTASTSDERGEALNLIGNALWQLGEWESGTTRLQEAVTTYRTALIEYPRDKSPSDFSMTSNNLGNALKSVGQRLGDPIRIRESIEAFSDAAEEAARHHLSQLWALIQNNLGTALQTLWEWNDSPEILDRAINAYQSALQQKTRSITPLEWAMIQDNLGTILAQAGERIKSVRLLNSAAEAFCEALKERTRDRVPLSWASTQTNLANVLLARGAQERDITLLRRAEQAYRQAVQEWTRERVPLRWAQLQNNMGNCLATIGELENNNELLATAIQAYRLALKERTRERVPREWAHTEFNLSNCLAVSAERQTYSLLILEEAITHMQNAVDGCHQVGDQYLAPRAEKRLAELKAKAQ